MVLTITVLLWLACPRQGDGSVCFPQVSVPGRFHQLSAHHFCVADVWLCTALRPKGMMVSLRPQLIHSGLEGEVQRHKVFFQMLANTEVKAVQSSSKTVPFSSR